MAEDLPDLVTHFKADLSDLETGIARGEVLVRGFRDTLTGAGGGGENLGRDLGGDIAKGLKDAEPQVRNAAQASGQDAGDLFGRGLLAKMFPNAGFETAGEKAGQDVGTGISKGVEPGLDDADREIKDRMRKTGQDAGAAAGQGISPLIIAAIAGAGMVGGPLLVAGLGAAMVGATALILKQNQVISADFSQVGKDAANAVTQAAAPLAGQLHQSLLAVDQQVTAMAPDLKNLFAAAEPDISAVTSGLTGLVGGLLPGLASALDSGQAIVSRFSASLPVLGADVGRSINAMVGNADMEGRALQATMNTLGNTVYTVGTLLGSTATAASPLLLGATHAVNALDDAVRAVGSPAVIGGVVGLFGAMKFDPAIASGLLTGAESLSKVADKAVPAGGLIGKLGDAASGSSVALSKMAGIMDGPWGLAIGAGVGLVSGLIGQLTKADDATKAITVSQGQLADAVAADTGTVGQNTAAFIAAQAQASGLAAEAKGAGVSLDLLTEAATGNQSALSQLVAVTDQANQVQRQQQLSAEKTLTGQTQLNQAFDTGSARLLDGAVATNTLSDANRQLLASVRAQTQQVADAVEKQAQLDAATNALNNTTNIFNATLDADYQKLVQHSQATADNAVAALNLGSGQSSLNQSMAASVTQYDEATKGAAGYDAVLNAVNGTMNTLLGSEAAFTIALDGVSKAASANGTSLDVNTEKGAKNTQTFTQLATSAQKAADALYQNEVGTKGANVAFQDANTKLQQEKQAFIDAADKAGFNRTKVKELADELYSLPADIPINVEANVTSAQDSVRALTRWIDQQTGTVTVQAADGSGVSYNPKSGGGKAYYDFGGWTKAAPGQPEEAVVHGGEYMLSQDMLAGRQAVDPRVLAALRSGSPGVGASSAPVAAGGGVGPVTVIAPIYLDGQMVGRAVVGGVTAEAQNTARRNSLTGLAANYR